MTITEALDYVKRHHNEDAAQRPHWSDLELYQIFEAKANEALSVLGLIEGKTTTTSTSGTADYAFPTNYVRIRRVWYDGIPLKYLNFREFEARQPGGTAPSGTPREYTLWNNTMTLIPTPDTSSDTITIYGEKQQSSLTTAAGTLDIPSIFHMALCDAVIGEMYAKDQNAGMANVYMTKWLQFHIPNMRTWTRRRQRVAGPTTVLDADSLLETEYGII